MAIRLLLYSMNDMIPVTAKFAVIIALVAVWHLIAMAEGGFV